MHNPEVDLIPRGRGWTHGSAVLPGRENMGPRGLGGTRQREPLGHRACGAGGIARGCQDTGVEAHTFVFPQSKPVMRRWRPKSAPHPGGQAVETALGEGWGGQGPTKGLPERPERQPASPSSVDLEFGTRGLST